MGSGTYMPLPEGLKGSNSLINIENVDDDKCLAYCLAADLLFKQGKFPASTSTGKRIRPYHTSLYQEAVKEVKLDSIQFPVSMNQVYSYSFFRSIIY